MTAFRSLSSAMFKGFVRDRMTVFFTILFPMFFIVIFGVVFAGNGASRYKVLEVGAVPFVDAMSTQARTDLDDALQVDRSPGLDDALAAVRKGDVAGAIEQRGNRIVLHFSNSDQVSAATVRGILNAFVTQANLAAAGVAPKFQLTDAQVEDQSLKAIQFIAPSMIAYGVSVGAVFGAAMTLITWREKKVLRRLRLAPVSTATVVGSRVAVSLGVAVLQLIIFVGFSTLPVLGLQLRGAWYMSIPLVLSGTLAFLSIGLLVGAVAKTAEGGSGLANLITLPMAFLSGAFLPVEFGPQWLATAAKFMPLGYLVTGMKDVMVRGQGPSAALLPIGVLLAFAAVFTFAATKLFRWDST